MLKKMKTLSFLFFLGLISFVFFACDMLFSDGNIEPSTPSDSASRITKFDLTETSLNMKVGDLKMIYMSYSPTNIKINDLLEFDYDSSIVAIKTITNSHIIIEAIQEGTCYFKVTAEKYSDACTIRVDGFSENYIKNQEPYIYSATSVLDMGITDKKKIFVSLYNGTVADNNNYTWSVDNKDVISLNPTGQYCTVEGKSKGYAQITVRNSAAAYPYYIGVYVSEDSLNATYITTSENIVTLYTNGSDKKISVDLINSSSFSASDFKYELFAGNGDVSYSTDCINITPNGKECILSPRKNGIACVRVKHPYATGGYPLDIIVRVVSIVDNVYIVPSSNLITVTDTEEKSFSARLVGLSGYNVDDFTFEISDDRLIDCYSVGDTFWFKGKCNGAVNVYIHHPNAQNSRQVLILLSNQAGGSIDSSYYITTTQNYIKTKVGADETTINISLKGGLEGDDRDFIWTIKQEPKEGTGDVIKLENVSGIAQNSKAVTSVYANGSAVLTPLKEGVATIILTHPKVYYPTEILVKVLNKDALLDEPLYFKGDAVVKFLNSEKYNYQVTLNGNNKSNSDDAKIKFESVDSFLSIVGNENFAELSSSGTGINIGHFNITHNKVEYPKEVLVLTADTEEELNSIKAFYTDKKYHSVNVNSTIDLSVNTIGFDTEDENGNKIPFDWAAETAKIHWSSSNSNIATVEKQSPDLPLFSTVTGKSAGKATIKLEYENYSCEFEVTVYPEGVIIGEIETTAYLTTAQNVVSLAKVDAEKKVSVTAIGINPNEFSNIEWSSNNEDICRVVSNGTSATLIATGEGEAVVTVDHPKSENSLKIYVRIGNEYISVIDPVCYISTNQDLFAVVKNSGMQQLIAKLVNAPENENVNQFTFENSNPEVIEFGNTMLTGQCYFRPIEAGQSIITVKNTLCEFTKEVLVVVANTEEELKGFKYLTTRSNVVTIAEGKTYKLDVSVANADDVILSGFSYSSDNQAICDIGQTTSATAILKGNKIGTTQITVEHTSCSYPLRIIVQVVDESTLIATPYIQVSNAIKTLNVSTQWTDISAELVGGDSESKYNFRWESKDSSILQVVGEQDKAKIRPIAEGTTYVEVSHPRAPYPVQILCICSKLADKSYTISVSTGNLIEIEPESKLTTIKATINGPSTDMSDLSKFSGYLTEYGIVDLRFNDNEFYIEPLKQGETTLVISHPKALETKKIIINVSKYRDFSIGSLKVIKCPAGDITFIDMQVPSYSYDTEVLYSLENENLATVSGNKSICVVQAVTPGLTTLYAKVVKASDMTEVLAEANAQLQVLPSELSSTYIQTSSSIFELTKGTRRTFTASLIGSDVSTIDVRNLNWKSGNPDVVKISGTDENGVAVGEQIYVEALAAGECTLTISHEKAPSNRVVRLIVPGAESSSIALNKTYLATERGDNKATISCELSGDEYDYSEVSWEIERSNGETIARILGAGKTVTIYSIRSGTTKIVAYLPNGKRAECTLEIAEPKQITVSRQTVRVQPGHTVTLPYTISPDNDTVTVTCYANDGLGNDYVTVDDLGHSGGKGTISITGITTGKKESQVSTCMLQTAGGSMCKLSIICSWDYDFRVNKSIIIGAPKTQLVVSYKCTPAPSFQDIVWNDPGKTFMKVGIERDPELTEDGYETGKFIFEAKGDVKDTCTIIARNPATDDVIGTQTISVDLNYKNATPRLILDTNSGENRYNYTYYDRDANILYLGDGEKIKLKLGFEEENIKASFSKISGDKILTASDNIIFSTASETNNEYFIESVDDYLEWEYKITEGYSPAIDNNKISLSNVKSGYKARSYTWQCAGASDVAINDEEYFGNQDTNIWNYHNTNGNRNFHPVGIASYKVFANETNIYDIFSQIKRTDHVGENGRNYVGAPAEPLQILNCDLYTKTNIPEIKPDNCIRDTSLDGQVFSKSSFESNPFFYLPAFKVKSCVAEVNNEKPGILYPMVSAIKRAVRDTSIKPSGIAEVMNINFKVLYNGEEKSYSIKVILQKRPCCWKYKNGDGKEYVSVIAQKGEGLTTYANNNLGVINQTVSDYSKISTNYYNFQKNFSKIYEGFASFDTWGYHSYNSSQFTIEGNF